MASLGRIPVFSSEDYAYWKVRMRAFLQSMGAEVSDITRNQAYDVLAVRTTPLQVSEHEANAKTVNALFAGISRAEFSRVQGFQKAHKIWTCLENYHEGTPLFLVTRDFVTTHFYFTLDGFDKMRSSTQYFFCRHTTTETLICPGWEISVVPVSQPGTPGRNKKGCSFVP